MGVASQVEDFPVVGSYDNQRTTAFNAERTINMFEYIDPDGKRPSVLFSTSGIVDSGLNFYPETGGSRASFTFNGAVYQVFGGTIFKITGVTSALASVVIGNLTTNTGFVGVDANTFQILFVDGTFGYIYDTLANTFVQIIDPGFPKRPIDCCYLDGFFVVADGQTNNFYLSSFNQGLNWSLAKTGTPPVLFTVIGDTTNNWLTFTTGTAIYYQTGTPFKLSVSGGGVIPTGLTAGVTYYAVYVDSTHIRVKANPADPNPIVLGSNGTPTINIDNEAQLQVGSITSHPGTIVACRTLHRRLFLFSQNYTEVWENAGIGTNLPFRRNNSLLMEVGTPAIGSVSVGFDAMFFLSQDKDGLGAVMGLRGSESEPVSNRALDYQLAQYAADQNQMTGASKIADARGILIKENGIIFYRLNFNNVDDGLGHTFVLNVSMSTPGQPRWHEEETLHATRHPAQTHAFYGGSNFYSDYAQAIFYRVDPTIVTNNGEPIHRTRITKNICPPGYFRRRIDRFQLDLLQGQFNVGPLEDVNLETENALDILTEQGINIILEGQQVANNTNPIVYLSISKDGGQSYGYKNGALMGKLGERTYRTVWRKLGVIPRGQGFVGKIEFYNETPFVILGAAWAQQILPE